MFPLAGQAFPKSAAELAAGIEGALREVLEMPGGAGVRAVGEWPELEALTVDLSGAVVKSGVVPARPGEAGERERGATVGRLEVMGHPIRYEQGKAEVEVRAAEVGFDFARDGAGRAMLVLTDARDGRVRVEVAKEDLRAMLLAAASAAARGQGVTIQDLEVSVEAEGDRAVTAAVRVKAKKAFMGGVINVKGRAVVDDDLVATVSGLSCTGEGVVGSMAAGMVQGKLRGYEGKRVPLMAFSMGDVKLRDLRISTEGAVRVTAGFGR